MAKEAKSKSTLEPETVLVEVMPRQYVRYTPNSELENSDKPKGICYSCNRQEEFGKDGKRRVVWKGMQFWARPSAVNQWTGTPAKDPRAPHGSDPLVRIVETRTQESAAGKEAIEEAEGAGQ